jgi:hypothetical protein
MSLVRCSKFLGKLDRVHPYGTHDIIQRTVNILLQIKQRRYNGQTIRSNRPGALIRYPSYVPIVPRGVITPLPRYAVQDIAPYVHKRFLVSKYQLPYTPFGSPLSNWAFSMM